MAPGNDSIKYAVAGLLLLSLASGCSPGKGKSEEMDKLFTVRQSDLVVGTLLRGTANAKEKHKLFAESAHRNKLTWIAEENASVKKGDVVIRFETQDLLENIDERKLNLETKQKSLDIAKEEKRILLSENQSSLRVARDAVVSSEEAHARYYKYDGRKMKGDLERGIDAAGETLLKAKEAYRIRMDAIGNTIYNDGAAKEKALAELEKLKSALKQKEQGYSAAKFSLRIFKKYTYPNTLTSKINALEHSRLNHEKVKVRTASMVIQKDEGITRIENRIKRDKKELKRVEGYLPMMEVKAPVDGIMVYGDVDQRGEQRVKIEVGMECYRHRVLATIPEMNHLIVNFEIPEQFHHRITEGASVIITPDAIPSLKVTGKVDTIAVVPVHQVSWDRTSPKIYRSKITLDAQNPDLVSGMNVRIEIIEEIIKQVVNVPVEAVFEEEGEYFVYLKAVGKTQKQGVELGKSNDQYVHIAKGLEVGDRVYLYSPYKLDASE